MKKLFKNLFPFILVSLLIVLAACNGHDDNNDNGNNNYDTYDVDAKGIPQFVSVNYIELTQITRISKFRSAEGHDYSDGFESCRSMKHYFRPYDDADWAAIKIYAPVSGRVSRIYEEWAGTQVQIKSDSRPAFYFIIFHIDLDNPLSVGDNVTAGQQLGTHIGSQTTSDIAVGVETPTGWKLISYFDVMTNTLFQQYQARGLNSRSDVIISESARDADPLSCDGETFLDSGTLEHWFELN